MTLVFILGHFYFNENHLKILIEKLNICKVQDQIIIIIIIIMYFYSATIQLPAQERFYEEFCQIKK